MENEKYTNLLNNLSEVFSLSIEFCETYGSEIEREAILEREAVATPDYIKDLMSKKADTYTLTINKKEDPQETLFGDRATILTININPKDSKSNGVVYRLYRGRFERIVYEKKGREFTRRTIDEVIPPEEIESLRNFLKNQFPASN